MPKPFELSDSEYQDAIQAHADYYINEVFIEGVPQNTSDKRNLEAALDRVINGEVEINPITSIVLESALDSSADEPSD